MSDIVIRIKLPEGATFHVESVDPDGPEDAPWPAEPTAFRGAANGDRTTCPVHHEPWKIVPAGISKKTQRPYSAFSACPVQGCEERPR